MRITGGQRTDAVLLLETDAIAITLAESPSQAVTPWTLTIDAKTHEGRYNVGVIHTTPAALGRRPNRVVAEACCPGALEWCVTVEGPRGAYSAELTIAGTRGGSPFRGAGARPVTLSKYISSGVALVASQGVSLAQAAAGPIVVGARLRSIEGINAGGADRFFQTFNATAVPANGTEPLISIPVPAGDWFYEQFKDDDNGGEFYTNGVVWAISTTASILTRDVDAQFRVRSQLEV